MSRRLRALAQPEDDRSSAQSVTSEDEDDFPRVKRPIEKWLSYCRAQELVVLVPQQVRTFADHRQV